MASSARATTARTSTTGCGRGTPSPGSATATSKPLPAETGRGVCAGGAVGGRCGAGDGEVERAHDRVAVQADDAVADRVHTGRRDAHRLLDVRSAHAGATVGDGAAVAVLHDHLGPAGVERGTEDEHHPRDVGTDPVTLAGRAGDEPGVGRRRSTDQRCEGDDRRHDQHDRHARPLPPHLLLPPSPRRDDTAGRSRPSLVPRPWGQVALTASRATQGRRRSARCRPGRPTPGPGARPGRARRHGAAAAPGGPRPPRPGPGRAPDRRR
jgi:hypothetical protein